MAVPRIGKIAEPCQLGISVRWTYGQTYGMNCTQLVTERTMQPKLFEGKQVFYNKNKLFCSCKHL